MKDVLKLYEQPLNEHASAVCIKEEPVVLYEDSRPPAPTHPGQAALRAYEYKRCETANAFCGIEPKSGRHYNKVTPTLSSPRFADYLLEIDFSYSLHAHPQGAGESLRREGGCMAVAAVYRPLHAQTPELAKSGRGRNQHLLPPMFGKTKNRKSRLITLAGSYLEPPRHL
jgi:hypothetical protein